MKQEKLNEKATKQTNPDNEEQLDINELMDVQGARCIFAPEMKNRLDYE